MRWKRERKEGGGRRKEKTDCSMFTSLSGWQGRELVLFPFFFLKIMSGDYLKKKYIQEQSASSGSIRENCPASD